MLDRVVSRNLFGQKLNIPSASTAENISDKAHVLSKVHATEKVLYSSGVTLHTDGTSRQKRQHIGQQITLSDGSLINLGFSEVVTEDSKTLLTLSCITWPNTYHSLLCHPAKYGRPTHPWSLFKPAKYGLEISLYKTERCLNQLKKESYFILNITE